MRPAIGVHLRRCPATTAVDRPGTQASSTRSGVLHSAGTIIYGGREVDVLTGAQHFGDNHRLSRVTFRVR
jgi:hypothetical protein